MEQQIPLAAAGAMALVWDLAMVLVVAAVTTVVFRALKQPPILGYLLAGVIVGPHTPMPPFADPGRVQAISELGVILMMFAIGLEFSLRRLVRGALTAVPVGMVEMGTMMFLGYQAGRFFGWGNTECLFTGAALAISSTMISMRALSEAGVEGDTRETVFSILVAQDLVAVLMIGLLTSVATGSTAPESVLTSQVVRLAAFLALFVLGGFLLVPRVVRAISRLGSGETLLVACVGICFLMALLAHEAGYSVALGAFLAGTLVAESGVGEAVERLVHPLRDVFAAVFFVSVGMMVDPSFMLANWLPIAALSAVVLAGQVSSVFLGGLFAGLTVRTSVLAGMSLAQVGEFSFIIVGVGVSHGAVRDGLLPVMVAVSVITAFLTPLLIRFSGPVALAVDGRLPRPLQTFISFYGFWLAKVRARLVQARGGSRARRLALYLATDTAVVSTVIIGAAIFRAPMSNLLESRFGLPGGAARLAPLGIAALVAAPFCIGLVNTSRALGALLARETLPAREPGKPDLAEAPRRMLAIALQLLLVALTGLPLLALTQPFIPALYSGVAFAALLAVLGVSFWRRAANLDGHVRAGAQLLIEVLDREKDLHRCEHALGAAGPLLPGLGPMEAVPLGAGCGAVGRTLKQLNLRGFTGASVLAIKRGEKGIAAPGGLVSLEAGDVLVLAGSPEALQAARKLLARPGPGG